MTGGGPRAFVQFELHVEGLVLVRLGALRKVVTLLLLVCVLADHLAGIISVRNGH